MKNKIFNKFEWNSITRDLGFGIICTIFFGIAVILSSGIQSGVAKNTGIVSAQFFPMLISISAFIFSICLTAVNAFKFRNFCVQKAKEPAAFSQQSAPGNASKFHWDRVCVCAVLMMIYVALMRPVGFIICSIVYLIVQITYLTPKKTVKGLIFTIILAVLVTMFLYLPFRYIFGVMLPMGIFS